MLHKNQDTEILLNWLENTVGPWNVILYTRPRKNQSITAGRILVQADFYDACFGSDLLRFYTGTPDHLEGEISLVLSAIRNVQELEQINAASAIYFNFESLNKEDFYPYTHLAIFAGSGDFWKSLKPLQEDLSARL